MAPAGLMMMLVSPVGAKVTLVLGALVSAVGYGSALGLMGSTLGLLAA